MGIALSFNPTHFNFTWDGDASVWYFDCKDVQIYMAEYDAPSRDKGYEIFIDDKRVYKGLIPSKMYAADLFKNLNIINIRNFN